MTDTQTPLDAALLDGVMSGDVLSYLAWADREGEAGRPARADCLRWCARTLRTDIGDRQGPRVPSRPARESQGDSWLWHDSSVSTSRGTKKLDASDIPAGVYARLAAASDATSVWSVAYATPAEAWADLLRAWEEAEGAGLAPGGEG